MANYNNNQQQGNQQQGGSSNSHYSCIATGVVKGRLAADPKVEYDQSKQRTKVSARILVNKKNQEKADAWNIVEYKDDKAEYPSANFRALAEFLKKGRFITVTGEIKQNTRSDGNNNYTNFMEVNAYPGGITMDSAGNEDGNTGGAQTQQQPSFGAQPQGNFGAQPQNNPQQGNFGGQQPQNNPQQGNFGGQPQGNFSGQPQGNFGGQPQQGNFGAPQQPNSGWQQQQPQQGSFGAPVNTFGR